MGGSLYRMAAVARNTLKEALRNRAFAVMMLASLVLVFSSLLLAQLAVVGQEKRIVQDFGLFFISLMGVVLAVTTGVILVHKELDRKTIFTVLARPLHRWEFIFGKYAGTMLLLLLQTLVLCGGWFIVLLVSGIQIREVYVMAVLLMFCEWMVISAVALLFSSFSSPMLSGLFTVAIFMVGRLVYVVDEMLQAKSRGLFVSTPALRPFGETVVRVFPDLSVFNISKEILLNQDVSWMYVSQAFLYCLCFVFIFIAAAALLFQRRDFV